MRTIERRLHALEQQHRGPGGFEVWIGDDPMFGPNWEELSRAEFEALYPDAIDIGGPLPYPEGATQDEERNV